MRWYQLPEDAGQIIDVTYALDGQSGLIYRCVEDRSCPMGHPERESYMVADLDGETAEDFRFEPWNGQLPSHGEWSPCAKPFIE